MVQETEANEIINNPYQEMEFVKYGDMVIIYHVDPGGIRIGRTPFFLDISNGCNYCRDTIELISTEMFGFRIGESEYGINAVKKRIAKIL